MYSKKGKKFKLFKILKKKNNLLNYGKFRYAYTGKPVVIIDGMKNWTAQNVFDFEFFKKIYTERMGEWSQHNCQFFPYKTEFKHLGQVFNMSKERAYLLKGTEPWYVGW